MVSEGATRGDEEQPEIQRLSDAEWRVMLAVWKCGSETVVEEILEAMDPEERGSLNAIRTLLARCEKKGYVSSVMIPESDFLPEGRGYHRSVIRPNITPQEALELELAWFVSVRLDADPERVAAAKEWLTEWKPGAKPAARRYQLRRRRSPSED